MNQRPCKGCGKPIIFAKNETGKIVPLDARAPVYEIKKDFDGESVASLTQENFYVSHFSICSKANDFSSSRGFGK